MATLTGRKLGDEIARALNLKHCRDLKIHIPIDGIVIITAEFNAQKEDLEKMLPIIKQYRLEKIPDMTKKYGLEGPNDHKVTQEEWLKKQNKDII